MTALYRDRTALLQNLLVAVVTLAAMTLLVRVLAYWTWVVLAPAPEASAPTSPALAMTGVAAPALFGHASARDADHVPTRLAITLLGTVVASAGRQGHALVQLGGQPSFVVREGERLAPGITLLEVGSDQIVLERAGQRETLAWPRAMTPALLSGIKP